MSIQPHSHIGTSYVVNILIIFIYLMVQRQNAFEIIESYHNHILDRDRDRSRYCDDTMPQIYLNENNFTIDF